jgi:hypothetical protein
MPAVFIDDEFGASDPAGGVFGRKRVEKVVAGAFSPAPKPNVQGRRSLTGAMVFP